MIAKNIKYFFLFFLAIGTLGCFILIFKEQILILDNRFYQYVVDFIRTDTLTIFMNGVTAFSGIKLIFLLTLFLIIIFRNNSIRLFILLNPLIVVFLNHILKEIVARKRPGEFFLIIEKGFSFPSGHSMMATAFYGFLIYLIYIYGKGCKRNILICVLTILIFLIMFSRIYLGVHYLSDVLSGFIISIIYLVIYISFFNQYVKGGVLNEKKKFNS